MFVKAVDIDGDKHHINLNHIVDVYIGKASHTGKTVLKVLLLDRTVLYNFMRYINV